MTTPWRTHGPDFNAWNSDFARLAALLNSTKNEPWWIKDWDLKYLNLRIDTRDNGFLLLSDEKNGKRERISPDRVVQAIEKYYQDFSSRRPKPGSANLPSLGSTVVNDACWKFIDAMPHNLPAPIFNDLKPALYAAVCHVLTTLEKEREEAAQQTAP